MVADLAQSGKYRIYQCTRAIPMKQVRSKLQRPHGGSMYDSIWWHVRFELGYPVNDRVWDRVANTIMFHARKGLGV